MHGRARLEIDGEGGNSSDVRKSATNFSLEPDGLAQVLFRLKRKAHGKIKIAIDPVLLHQTEALDKSQVGIGMTLMDLSQPIRSHIRGEDDARLGTRKGLFEGRDKIDGGQPKGFEDALQGQSLFANAREEAKIIVRMLGVGIEGNMKRLIAVRESFFDRSENMFLPPERHLPPARNRLLVERTAATPGALNRAAPADGKVKDRGP